MTRAWVLSLAALAGCPSNGDAKGQPPTCDALSVQTAEGCVRAGPSTCGVGFTRDDEHATCEPILPAAPCGRGTLAVPGDPSCRAVGTIDAPAAESVVYVDASAAPGGDGSAERPFRTVQAGVDAAPVSALVRVAAGTYAENVRIQRPLTLLGADAAEVEIRGIDAAKNTVDVRADALVAGLAITGPGQGLSVTDASVTASHLWVHDTGKPGVGVDRATKTARLALTDSLVESCAYAGVAVFGADLELNRSAVRDTKLLSGAGGPGVLGQRMLDVSPMLVVRGSVLERNREVGVGVAGGSLTVEDSVVRDTGAMANGTVGTGVLASYDKATRTAPTLIVRGSLVASNLEVGVAQTNGVGTIERTVIRGTRAAPKHPRNGTGVQADPGTTMSIRESVIEDNRHIGVAFFAATARIERTIVRGTRASAAPLSGIGIELQPVAGLPSRATLTQSLVLDNQSAGIMFADGAFTMTSCVVRGTIAASDGRFGDGIYVHGQGPDDGTPLVDARDVVVESNARAGVTLVTGTLRLAGSRLRCNAVDLGRAEVSEPGEAIDAGGNVCGCEQTGACKMATSALEAVPFPERAAL